MRRAGHRRGRRHVADRVPQRPRAAQIHRPGRVRAHTDADACAFRPSVRGGGARPRSHRACALTYTTPRSGAATDDAIAGGAADTASRGSTSTSASTNSCCSDDDELQRSGIAGAPRKQTKQMNGPARVGCSHKKRPAPRLPSPSVCRGADSSSRSAARPLRGSSGRRARRRRGAGGGQQRQRAHRPAVSLSAMQVGHAVNRQSRSAAAPLRLDRRRARPPHPDFGGRARVAAAQVVVLCADMDRWRALKALGRDGR